MPRLSVIKEKTEPFKAMICGETIEGRYKPAIWTASFVDEIGKVSDARQGAEMIAASIAEWDLLDDKDSPIALDVETIYHDVPLAIQKAILEAVVKAQAPGNAPAGSSSGSF